LRGSTAGCGSGASVGAAAAGVLVVAAGLAAVLELLLESSLDPHPATTNAINAMDTASQNAPRLKPRATGICVSS
ncbi:MAG: hypothetical protein ACXWZZ_03155, partial [Solirubrobacteraceae bacterium]